MPNEDNVVPFPARSGKPAKADAGAPMGVDDILARVMAGEIGAIELLPALREAMGFSFGGVDGDHPGFGRVRPVLIKPGSKRVCFVVRLDLDNARPPIWRRLRLASNLRLSQVHDVIQTAMGWTDSHLHHFQMGPDTKDFRVVPFLTPFDLEEGDTDGTLEEDVRLDQVIAKPGHRLFYEYDFGDSWQHTVKLEKVEPWVDSDPVATCVAGRRACPPEDVGGLPGYEEVLAALDGRVEPDEAEWMAEKVEWLPLDFDPAAFDIDEVNRLLQEGPPPPLEQWHPVVADLLVRDRSLGSSGLGVLVKAALRGDGEVDDRIVEQATLRYRVLLRTIGGGLQLTAAGYLPPHIVDSLCRELDLDADGVGKGNRERLTLPVLTLRESATALGLVRKARGRLTVTKAGEKVANDPARLLDHVRARLPLGREFERDAGVLGLLFVAAGRDWWQSRSQAAEIAASLGWIAEGGDLGRAVTHSARSTIDVLDHLAGRRESAEYRCQIARLLLQTADSTHALSRAPISRPSHRP